MCQRYIYDVPKIYFIIRMGVKLNIRKRTYKNKKGNEVVIGYYQLSTIYGTIVDKNGKKKPNREYENLGLIHHYPPYKKGQADENKLNKNIAERVFLDRKQKFLLDKHSLKDTNKAHNSFFEYWDKLCKVKQLKDSNSKLYNLSKGHIIKYRGKHLKIIDIDYNFCRGFYSYLKSVRSKRNKPLSSSTIVDYYKKLTGVCEELKREGIINENPASKVKIDKAIHKAREWMTIDELQQAIKTPCDNLALKNFYLLSCFTGLRHKNVIKLKWKNYVIEGNKHFIKCKLVKTGKPIEIPLHLNGQKLLGDIGRMGDDDLLIQNLNYGGGENEILAEWIIKAGIKKCLPPHTARHTFAVQFIQTGNNPLVLQHLLGHSDFSATQRYVHIADEHPMKEINKMHTYNI